MSLSLAELRVVAQEVAREIEGGVVRGLAVPEPDIAVLTVEAAGSLVRVLFSVRKGETRMHLTRMDLRNPRDTAPAFLGPARRELLGATVERVSAWRDDRVVTFELAPRRLLLFEGTGHHPNLFVLWPDRRIICMLRPSLSHRRDLRPGTRYVPPLPHPVRSDAIRFLGAFGSVSEEIERHYMSRQSR